MDHERSAQNDDEGRRREELTQESATPTTATNPQLNEGNLSPTGPIGGSQSRTGGFSSGGSMGGGARSGPFGEGHDTEISRLNNDLDVMERRADVEDDGNDTETSRLDSDLGPTEARES